MNHPSQFARLSPGADAKAADARPSLLPASAATFNDTKQQTGTGTERGRARGVMCRFALAVAQDWSRKRAGFFGVPKRRGSHPLAVCGTTRAGRPFVVGRFPEFSGLRGGCSRHLANVETLGHRTVQSLAQGLPSHFINSVRYGTNVAKEPMNAVHEKRTSRSGEQNDR